DFTRLASRIREDGVTVYGFGERKTPEAFRNACDRFTYLDVLAEPSADAADTEPAKARVTSAKLRTDSALVGVLRASISSASLEDGWADLAAVGSLVRKQRPDFDSRNWGYAKLSDLVREIGLFEVGPRPGGGVRVKIAPRPST
ncbi:MAG: OST-HTH/LOTUS domain-containing protein, partial [Humibacter sp.]